MSVHTLILPHSNSLQDLRHSIDHIDAAFIHLLAERMRAVAKIDILKIRQNLASARSKERAEDLNKTLNIAATMGLSFEFIRPFFERIYNEGRAMMEKLKDDPPTMDRVFVESGLDDLRDSLLHLDLSICYLLVERFRVVERVGTYKKNENLSPLDENRWSAILKTKSNMAGEMGLNVSMARDILDMIHEEALRLEDKIIKKEKPGRKFPPA